MRLLWRAPTDQLSGLQPPLQNPAEQQGKRVAKIFTGCPHVKRPPARCEGAGDIRSMHFRVFYVKRVQGSLTTFFIIIYL
jgi:hypothetical protein